MKLLLFATILFAAQQNSVFAQSTVNHEQALELIASFAERYCEDFQARGYETDTEISGEARIELSRLLGKILDLGVDAATDLSVKEYDGIARNDLLEATQSVLECRLAIFPDLSRRLLLPDGGASYKCPIPGDPSGSGVERARLFNSKGVEYARRGERLKAIECYEKALEHDPDNLTVLRNLFLQYRQEEHFDEEKALYYIDRSVSVMQKAMADLDPYGHRMKFQDDWEESDRRRCRIFPNFDCKAVPALERCHRRSRMTGEFFTIDDWIVSAELRHSLGRTEESVEVVTQLIQSFPKHSCAHDHQVARALTVRADYKCKLGMYEEAAVDLEEAVKLAGSSRLFGEADQEFLQDAGYYDGPIDGKFGPNSTEALVSWAKGGCKHIEGSVVVNKAG